MDSFEVLLRPFLRPLSDHRIDRNRRRRTTALSLSLSDVLRCLSLNFLPSSSAEGCRPPLPYQLIIIRVPAELSNYCEYYYLRSKTEGKCVLKLGQTVCNRAIRQGPSKQQSRRLRERILCVPSSASSVEEVNCMYSNI